MTEAFVILGQVGHPAFGRWIVRHAARLGVGCEGLVQEAGRVEMRLSGPAQMLDAMEMGCSLGPQEVLVDRIERVVLVDRADG